MRSLLSKKQLALLIFTTVVCASNMFMKPILEACRLINGLDESNAFYMEDAHFQQIVIYNYLLAFHYIIIFVILTIYIVMLVSLDIKATAFLSLYKEGKHGETNDLSSEEEFEKLMLINRFETANDLIWTTDAFAIASLICLLSSLFCAWNDKFKALQLWSTDFARAGRFSLFPGWAFELFAVPNTNMSDYAILWMLPMFVVIIALTFHSYYQFYKSKKAFCSVFPDVPEERFLEPLIILKKHRRVRTSNDPLFSQDYAGVNKIEPNMFLRQEDIDGEEEGFFMAEDASPKTETASEIIREPGSDESEEQELIPDGLDMSRLKFRPGEQEEENLITCPLCGSLNPEGAEECVFCGGTIKND